MFFSALRVAATMSPPSRYGIPQQTCSGHETEQAFFSRTATVSRPTSGSL
jgi:hypothetical protein